MYTIVYGGQFLQSAKKLGKDMKPKLKASLDILSENPFYPALHTKALSGKLAGYYSFRLGRDWRIIFEFLSSDTIYLLNIGNRKDIYR